MFVSYDYDTLETFITELRILAEEARARCDLPPETEGLSRDYWYGLAEGYQDAAKRIEALMRADQKRLS